MLSIQEHFTELENILRTKRPLSIADHGRALIYLKNIATISAVYRDGYIRYSTIKALLSESPEVPAGVEVLKKEPYDSLLNILTKKLNTRPDPKVQKNKRGLKKFKKRKPSKMDEMDVPIKNLSERRLNAMLKRVQQEGSH